MNSKRTYLRDPKGRFASKPDDSSNFLKYMVLSAINYFKNKGDIDDLDFEHLINNPEMQGKDYTNPDNNETNY